MTRSEYQKMIKNSPVYPYLSRDFKEKVLGAGGDDMARYASMLQESNITMAAAQTDLTERNEKVLLSFKEDVRRAEKDKNERVESQVRQRDSNKGENLLDELNKIN